jgi:hypothetical protein
MRGFPLARVVINALVFAEEQEYHSGKGVYYVAYDYAANLRKP